MGPIRVVALAVGLVVPAMGPIRVVALAVGLVVPAMGPIRVVALAVGPVVPAMGPIRFRVFEFRVSALLDFRMFSTSVSPC